MYRIILVVLFLFCGCIIWAQEKEKDTIQKLNEVIITGQYSKQSVKKSVFDVKVISNNDIKQIAANNLADLLNQKLNVSIIPNTQKGRSEVSLFGLDGGYFKILIDNVPVVSDTGVGNNVDLTQINLDNVQQIEIVEGSMAVNFGGNAVTGIINIITKKESQHKWEITPSLQEETIGNEYSWFSKGRHIQSLNILHNYNDKFFISAYANRNDFTGFFNGRKGKNYIAQPTDTEKYRGYDWLPKLQYNYNTLLTYKNKSTEITYRFDYLNELINYYNMNLNNQTYYTAIDTDYFVNRYINHLNINGNLLGKMPFQFDLSHQNQDRKYQNYTYYLYTHQEDRQELNTYQSRNNWYSKGTLTQNFNDPRWQIQWGYEANRDKGFGSAIAGEIISTGNLSTSKEISSLDFFSSAEYKPNKNLFLRPGFRYSFQSLFDNQWAVSLSSRVVTDKSLEWRTIIGSSYRTPNYDELYTYVNDGNHQIYGKEDLLTERSFSAFTYIKNKYKLTDDLMWDTKIKFGYMNVKDRITLSIVKIEPLIYQYINVDKFKSLTLSSENQWIYKNFNLNIGGTLLGTKSYLNYPDGTSISDDLDEILLTFQINSTLAYNYYPWDLNFVLNYKYIGKYEEFVQKETTSGNLSVFKGITEPYHWIDFSVKKQFFKRKTELTLGVRNLANVTKLSTTTSDGTSHGTTDSGLLTMGYGRSYFIKLKHQFNF